MIAKNEMIKADSSERKTAEPGNVSKPSIAERKRAAGLKGMKDPLFERYEKILEIQIELDMEEGIRKYSIGIHVAEIIHEAKTYGKRAVRQLADAMGRDKSTLVDYGKVAWIWNFQEFKNLMTREGIRGIGVSFSHLIEIAAWDDQAVREELIERVLEEGLSVKALRQAVNEKKKEVTAGSTSAAVDSQDDDEAVTPASVRRSIARLSSDVKSIPAKAKEWEARVTKPLEDDPGQVNEAVACGLIEKRDANNEAIKTLQDENRQIDEILNVTRQAQVTAVVSQVEGGEQDV